MGKTSWTLVLLSLLAVYGCGDDDVNCVEMAGHPDCLPSCMADPTLPGCDAFDLGTRDQGVEGDAGPCGSCPADTVCDPAAAACVACLGDAECPDGVCLVDATDSANNQCVECLESDDCTDGVCDTTSNECVGCLMDGDCTEPGASACDTESNTCVGCSTDAQCSRLTDTPVCNEGTETCVECAADDESACGTNVCDVAMGACTETPEGSASLCEECVSDRQCTDGRVCALRSFDGTDLTPVCLWRRDATETGGPMGSCGSIRPYSDAHLATTVGGDSVEVCDLGASTCEALADSLAETCTMDSECGANDVADAICRLDSSLGMLCHMPCDTAFDCKVNFDCNTEAPSYCVPE